MKITANMVTVARVAVLPIPCALLLWFHENGPILWFTAALFITLGATDFVDGLMARRDGPTRFGALLDPIADKIFVAAILLPWAAIGWAPIWVVASVFARELMVTALRSAAAVREERIQTSVLAKLKTIVQMGGMGTIFFGRVMPQQWAVGVMVFGAAASLAFIAWRRLTGRRVLYWTLPVFGAFVLVGLGMGLLGIERAEFWQWMVIFGITWASGIDYLIGSARLFLRTGLRLADLARIAWVVAWGAGVVPVIQAYPNTVLPILVALSAEIAAGGVDNVVTEEKKIAPQAGFWVSAVLAGGFGVLFWGMAAGKWALPAAVGPEWVAGALAVTSLVFGAGAMWKHAALFRQTFDLGPATDDDAAVDEA